MNAAVNPPSKVIAIAAVALADYSETNGHLYGVLYALTDSGLMFERVRNGPWRRVNAVPEDMR